MSEEREEHPDKYSDYTEYKGDCSSRKIYQVKQIWDAEKKEYGPWILTGEYRIEQIESGGGSSVPAEKEQFILELMRGLNKKK
jgi:hypothetical protein